MTKIVVLGSCRFEPYNILFLPNKLNPDLYKEDHEKAYKEACKLVYPAIDACDEVWIYSPDGKIGKHTQRDILYAEKKGKRVLLVVKMIA